MINQQELRTKIQEVFQENDVYLNFIGIYDSSGKELFSLEQQGYDSSFDENIIYGYKMVQNMDQKILTQKLQEQKEIQSFFASYENYSYFSFVDKDKYFLVVFKKGFNNYEFINYLKEILKKIID